MLRIEASETGQEDNHTVKERVKFERRVSCTVSLLVV